MFIMLGSCCLFMSVGLTRCEYEDCEKMVPNPPKPVLRKYGGVFCDDHKYALNSKFEEGKDFNVNNESIEALQSDIKKLKSTIKEAKRYKNKGAGKKEK